MSDAPFLARAVFDQIAKAPRKLDSIEMWGRRQGWKPADISEAITWLDNEKMIRCSVRGSDDWAEVRPGVKPPEGESFPTAYTKDGGQGFGGDGSDDEDSEEDEDGDGSDDENSEEDEDEDDSDDQDEEETPESEERPAPRWVSSLEGYLGAAVRTRHEVSQWAMARNVDKDDWKKQVEAWRAEGRLTSNGAKQNPRYCLDEAPLVRNQAAKVEEPKTEAKPAKAARKAPARKAPAPKAKRAPRAKTPTIIALPAPPEAPSVLELFARLPGKARIEALGSLGRISELKTEIEEIEATLATKRAELDAALRGEAPKVEAPAMLARARAAVARKKTGRPPQGEVSIEDRVRSAFTTGIVRPGEDVSAPELGERLDLAARAVSRPLSTLVAEGYLERPAFGRYRLAAKGKKGRAA
jgi:hypothetical protein